MPAENITKTYSGQGPVLIAPRLANGEPGVWRQIGNLDPAMGFEISLTLNLLDVDETESGHRETIDRHVEKKSASAKFGMRAWSPKNIALSVFGEQSVVPSGTRSAWPLPTGLVAGDIIYLPDKKVSSVALVDSAGSPASLNTTTHYSIDEGFARVTIKSVAGLTQPFKASYSYAERIVIPVLGESELQDFYLSVEAVNTHNAQERVAITLFRWQPSPAKTRKIIQEKGFSVAEMDGMLLADQTKPAGGDLGRYGTIELLDWE